MESSLRMKIALMLRTLEEEQGIGIYARNLAFHLLQVDRRNHYTFLYVNQARCGEFGRHENLSEVVLPLRNKFWWDQVTVARYARRHAIDVILSTKYAVPLFTRAKTAMVFHATEWFVYPHFYPRLDVLYNKIFLPLYIRKAAAVSSVSNYTSRDMARFVKFDPDKVFVIHTGVDPAFKPVTGLAALAACRKKFGLSDRFILFVGKNYPGKNIPNAARAFQIIRERLPFPVKLVAVGKLGPEHFQGFVDAQTLKDIRFTGWVDQREMPALYSLADVLFFPSFYESFGIPIVEAMSTGCPVVTSETGACPEIAGQGALFVDPQNPKIMANAVIRVITEEGVRTKLVAKGFEEAKRFSWKKTAEETGRMLAFIGDAKQQEPVPADQNRKRPVFKALLGAAKFLLSAGLLAYLFSHANFSILWLKIQIVRWKYFLFAYAVALLDRGFMAFKWRLLAKPLGLNLTYAEAFANTYMGNFAGEFLPASIGGDIVRVSLLKRAKKPVMEGAASIGMERYLGLFSLLATAGLARLAIGPSRALGPPLLGPVAFALLAALAIVLPLLFHSAPSRFWKRAVLDRTDHALARNIHRLLECYRTYRHHRACLLNFSLLSMAEVGLVIVVYRLVGLCLSIEAGWLQLFQVVPLILLVLRLPISMNGWGLQEGLLSATLLLVGQSLETALVFSALLRLLAIVVMAPAALLFFRKTRGSALEFETGGTVAPSTR